MNLGMKIAQVGGNIHNMAIKYQEMVGGRDKVRKLAGMGLNG